jgi:cobalamin biosynthesis protein CobD/CbiB
MIYDIIHNYLLQLGLHPVAVVGKLVQKWETATYTRWNKTQNNKKTVIAQHGKQTYKTRKQTAT